HYAPCQGGSCKERQETALTPGVPGGCFSSALVLHTRDHKLDDFHIHLAVQTLEDSLDRPKSDRVNRNADIVRKPGVDPGRRVGQSLLLNIRLKQPGHLCWTFPEVFGHLLKPPALLEKAKRFGAPQRIPRRLS